MSMTSDDVLGKASFVEHAQPTMAPAVKGVLLRVSLYIQPNDGPGTVKANISNRHSNFDKLNCQFHFTNVRHHDLEEVV